MAVNIAANLVAASMLPAFRPGRGLGVGFGLANLLGMIVAWRILSRRMRGLDGRTIASTVGRMYAATIPAALLALFVSLLVRERRLRPARRGGAHHDRARRGGAFLVYVLFARSLRITELTGLRRAARSRARPVRPGGRFW